MSKGNKMHIGIFGETNAGKSSLLNTILRNNYSMVSKHKGTTTDPVFKSYELTGVGPVVFIDTPGLNDSSELGYKRVNKAIEILERIDFLIFVENNRTDEKTFFEIADYIEKYKINYIRISNKFDENSSYKKEGLNYSFSVKEKNHVDKFLEDLIKLIKAENDEKFFLEDIYPENSNILLVIPIDIAAPAKRLILPQVEIIRELIDNELNVIITTMNNLKYNLLKNIDLVITDSQMFKEVYNEIKMSKLIKKPDITSFSIIFAKKKGDLKEFIEGVYSIKSLNKDSKVLIVESCSHFETHLDIGRVKIPKLLIDYLGFDIDISFQNGKKLKNIENFDLVIHCGGCMLTKKHLINRINECKYKNVNIVNYGIILAYFTGVLENELFYNKYKSCKTE